MQTDHSSSPTQPLPAVHIHPGDQADIPLLLEDYAGCDGELRAVLQYTYQAALLKKRPSLRINKIYGGCAIRPFVRSYRLSSRRKSSIWLFSKIRCKCFPSKKAVRKDSLFA